MNDLRKLTVKDIRDLGPCYDPVDEIESVTENSVGTVLDILKMEGISDRDKIWVVTRLIKDRSKRLFAVWCARGALKLIKDPDSRSIDACNVAAAAADAAYAAADAAYADAAYADARSSQVKKLLEMLGEKTK
jgi:hypothetical protein